MYLGAIVDKEGGGNKDIKNRRRRRRWNWLGHILRREDEDDCKTALGWQPEGGRARGRPKTTWRRTVEKKRNEAGMEKLEYGESSSKGQDEIEC